MKNGTAGVCIESRRGNETAWTTLTNALRSPYNDARLPLAPGQPELRTYRLRYRKGNDAFGDASDTMIMTMMP